LGTYFTLGTFTRREGGASFPGLVLGDRVVPFGRLDLLSRRLNVQPTGEESVLALLSSWDSNFTALRTIAEAVAAGDSGVDTMYLDELHVRPPIDVPRQIFCTIANFRSHIVDTVRDPALTPRLGEPDSPECLERAARAIEERLRSPPYVCFKLPSTVIGAAEPMELPRDAQRTDWEVELGVVIGRTGRHIKRGDAMSFVAGYTLTNDITVRDWVLRPDLPRLGSDWLQSKNAPGFLPMGPWFVPAAFLPDPYSLRLTLRLNGEVMQDEQVSDMLFDIESQIEYISRYALLLPGDVICTGTPAGSGTRYKRFLKPGDVMEASAPGFGAQRTPCV
jgi:2,4-didehydro-3-deoxy-L-rhamnonate hydrolase